MSDRCQTHKARACQKCAGDAGVRSGWRAILHDGATTQHAVALTWTECNETLAALAEAESDLLAGDACIAVGCRAPAERDRLAGVVAAVRELADQWNAGRSPNGGRQLLSVTDVVDRLNAALDQADRDAAEWREIHRGMRDDRDPS